MRSTGRTSSFRQHHPADPPAGHAIVFRERVDDDDIVAQRQRGHVRRGVGKAVIDLVRDGGDPELARRRDELFEVGGRNDRAGRVGRAGKEHALQRLFGMRGGKVCGGQVAAADGLDLDHLDAERGEDVAIGRIAGRRHRDAVADVEHGEEGEVERRRRAGRHRNPLRRDRDAVVLVVVRGDRLAQAAQAERVGIADAAVLQRARCRLANRQRCGIGGLPDRHRDHRMAKAFQAIGLGQHVHRVERLDIAASGQG